MVPVALPCVVQALTLRMMRVRVGAFCPEFLPMPTDGWLWRPIERPPSSTSSSPGDSLSLPPSVDGWKLSSSSSSSSVLASLDKLPYSSLLATLDSDRFLDITDGPAAG